MKQDFSKSSEQKNVDTERTAVHAEVGAENNCVVNAENGTAVDAEGNAEVHAAAPQALANETTQADYASVKGKGKSSSKVLLIVVIALLVAVLAGAGVYFYMSSNADNEEVAYSILENNDNPADYQEFLQKYPQSVYAPEVKQRLQKLESMLQRWASISLSDKSDDFVQFKNLFDNPRYARLCDIKIDSLDFIRAQRLGTEAAFQSYLDAHPDGRYASEASVAQGAIRDREITAEEQEQVIGVITSFFQGFEKCDETMICSNITATMKRFLSQTGATKADVVKTITGMFNEHIQGCQFIVNRDIQVVRQTGSPETASYTVTFTVDQHIQRDDEGKTFGSYQCTAEVTPQLLISSLVMQEVSKQ